MYTRARLLREIRFELDIYAVRTTTTCCYNNNNNSNNKTMFCCTHFMRFTVHIIYEAVECL